TSAKNAPGASARRAPAPHVRLLPVRHEPTFRERRAVAHDVGLPEVDVAAEDRASRERLLRRDTDDPAIRELPAHEPCLERGSDLLRIGGAAGCVGARTDAAGQRE